MKICVKVLAQLYKIGILVFVVVGGVYILGHYIDVYDNGWELAFSLGFYAPAVGMLTIISAQLDLLDKIQKGEPVNIKARCVDFIHWLLLVFMNIGAWMVGGTSIAWFVLKVILLGVIGASIGIGIQRRWQPSTSEKKMGAIVALAAVLLGIASGVLRVTDPSHLGYGWAIETLTAVIGTIIVIVWISMDIRAIVEKAAAYPRSMFLKSIFSNLLVLWFWFYLMTKQDIQQTNTWIVHAGITFNVLVGNVLYFAYYGLYEYHHFQQKKR